MSHLRSNTYFLYKGIAGYKRFMKILTNSKLCKDHPEIKDRIKTIVFFDKYGLSPTHDAFHISRSTIYSRKKKLRDANGSLHSLANDSRKPKEVRRMYVETKIYEFIRDLRQKYPTLSKDKIKPLLDDFCKDNSLSTLSSSTIGKIIKRHSWFFYLYDRSRVKKKQRQTKKRIFGYEVKYRRFSAVRCDCEV